MTSNPTSCFDTKLQTHYQFDNPSDALLAGLSLTNGVEDSILDLFFSVIQNSNFNPKEVTFSHSGDVHCAVAKLRQEALRSLGNRSSESWGMVNLTIGLPNVVLDGVIDVLKTELDDTILAVRSRDGIGFASLEPPFSCYGRSTGIRQQREPFSAAFRTLAACSVVHTTWLGRARRALGSSLVVWPKLRTSITPHLSHHIRNPCYSTWTREIELSINTSDQKTNFKRLSSLLSRMPSVRFLQLNFTERSQDDAARKKLSDVQAQTIVETICSLRELEVLTLVIENHRFPGGFFGISLPALKKICLVGLDAGDYLNEDPSASPSLNQLICLNPRLLQIVIGPVQDAGAMAIMRLLRLTTPFISWTRRTTDTSNSTTNNEFSLHAMGLMLCHRQAWTPSPLHYALLSKVRHLRVCCTRKLSTAKMIRAATSASSLTLCAHDSEFNPDEAILALDSLPDSVERVVVVFPPIKGRDAENRWGYWDDILLSALTRKAGVGAECNGRLRAVTLAFEPSEYLVSLFGTTKRRRRTSTSGGGELISHLPRSKAWCEKYDIVLELVLVNPNNSF